MLLKCSNAILSFLWIFRIALCEEFCTNSGSDGACHVSSSEDATLAESYLQSFALHGARKLRITAEGEQEEAPIQLLGVADRESMLLRSQARATSYNGHVFYLNRVLNALQMNETETDEEEEVEIGEDGKPRKKRKSKKKGIKKVKKLDGNDPTGKNLEAVVGDFIDAQSESKDACHSQLYEARHQLNQLHDIVIQLAQEVQTTEQAIVVLDKALQEKLKELEELEVWKKKELDICEKKRQEAIEMFRRLSNELDEMHQIASPGVSMDIKGRIVHDSLLQSQVNTTGPLRETLLHKFGQGGRIKEDPRKALQTLSTLMTETQRAEQALQACKARGKHTSFLDMGELKPRRRKAGKGGCKKSSQVTVTVGDIDRDVSPYTNLKDKMKDTYRCSKVNDLYHGVVWLTCSKGQLTADAERCFKGKDAEKEEEVTPYGGGPYEVAEQEEEGKTKPSSKECLEEKEEMEKIYVKAYVELSRLKTEYDELANSTACFDAVNTEYKAKRAPLQEAADTLSDKINALEKKLESLRPRLESATNAEAILRKQVKTLTNQCEDLEPTISDLDKVRDAIRALSECPGLSRSKFALPKWIGEWVRIKQTTKGQTDKALDKKMNEACSKAAKGTRAAEVGEIEEATVLGIPRTNEGKVPLIGACPNCEGDDDKDRASGHLRLCWRANKPLNMKDKSTNCGEGPRVVLCVADNPNIRVIPGEGEYEDL